MRSLGAKFPVYLMVTKIDLSVGMACVLKDLPPELKKQSLGKILQSPDKKALLPVAVQIKKALGDILDHFRSLCLFSHMGPPAPHGILAWEEIKSVMPALNAFAEELFTENPYQETPLLRGIFFSSALRSGAERQSRAFPTLDALVRRLLKIRESGGVFLHDFFSRILPDDRNLNVPIAEYLRWRSSTRILAYAAMLLAAFSLSALIFISYERNDAMLRSMSLPTIPKRWDGDMQARILVFERSFREAAQMEHTIANSDIPTMGFNQSKKALSWFNRKLNAEFNENIFARASLALDNKRAAATRHTPDNEFNLLAADLMWRFDLLDAVMKGKSFDELLKIPAVPQGLLHVLNVGDIALLVPSMAYSVTRYYYGITDQAEQEQRLRSMRAGLSRLPTLKDNSMEWLTQRANSMASLAPLQGGIFWRGAMSEALNQVQIDPVYTAAGHEITMDYLNRLELIVAGSEKTSQGQSFLRWYASTYVEAWRSFALDFAQRMQELANSPLAADSMTLMSSDNNPFFQFLMRMDEELQPIRPWLAPVPTWVDDLTLVADALRVLKAADEQADPSLGKRLTNATRELVTIFDDTVDTKTRAQHNQSRQIAKTLQACLDSLKELVRYTLAEDMAFNVVQGAMPDENNKEAATSPLTIARTALLTFQNSVNTAQEVHSPVFALNNGAPSFFMTRLINSASCHIQALWEGQVLAKAGGIAPLQLQQALFAEPGGLARDFADKTLTFMLNRTLHGYEPKKLNDAPLPFTDDFLDFLNTGIYEYEPLPQQYGVTVSAVPMDVNDEALEKPFAASLSLDCARQKQEMINYNSPASRHFDWQKDSCGDTKLAVRFKSVTLDVVYDGANGFINFLHDFQYGYKTFRATDFPAQEAILKKLGISEITLRYKISGAEAVLRAAKYAPGALPFVASQCRR
jgi:type VI secretion system protein ImpL